MPSSSNWIIFEGYHATRRGAAMVQEARRLFTKRTGKPGPKISQGGLSGSVGASGGTHLRAAQVVFLNLDPAHLWDQETPKEDDMLSDDQIAQLAEQLTNLVVPRVTSAVIAQLQTQKIPTRAEIALEVLNSRTSDIVEVNDKRGKVRPATALSEIHKALSRGIGTATHL